MNVTEAQWMAYVDGELDAASASLVEQAIRSDPQLAAQVAAQQRLRARLQAAYTAVLDEPVPSRLWAATTHTAPARTRQLPTWMAAAASLALGVVLASWWQGASREPVRMSPGGLVAAAGLEAVLDRRLTADAPVDGMSAGLSFRTQEGAYCRTFVLADDALAGLACRAPDHWRVVALVTSASASAPATGTLRQASSPLPAAVLAAVDARLVGEPLDAAGERRARETGWR